MLQPGEQIVPIIDSKQCIALVQKLFGLQVTKVRELNGYDDKNFQIFVGEDIYVLKILNSLDSQDLVLLDGQTQIMRFLGEENGVKCPRPLKTIQGKYFEVEELESGRHAVRLMKFVHGKILHEVQGSRELFYKAGEYIARIDNLLKNFRHPSYDTHESFWMLDCLPKVRKFLPIIEDEMKRSKFEEIILEFEQNVLRIIDSLPRGIIHGDFNEQNVVVTEDGKDIAGILDFGDSQKGCYVYELAIAMAYMMIVSKKLEVGGYVLQGYLKQRMVTAQEMDLLKICILGRLTTSLVMGAYSAHLQPANAEYILTTSVYGWELFNEIYSKTNSELVTKWLAA